MKNITDRVLTKFITLTSGKLDYTIGYEEKLNGKKILAIETHRVGELAKDPDGNTVAADTVFEAGFLTLSIDSEETIDSVPFTVFNRPDNNGLLTYLGEGKQINLANSKVRFATGTTITSSTVVALTFHYKK